MGVVWAARHTVTRKAVALKMLRPEKALDSVRRARFLREARAASAVVHPNIIAIRDFIELEDGTLAMVMDLLEGESLAQRLAREGRMTVDTLAPIMVQVLSAVGTAHAAGIVHRDLKPDNIFLVPDRGRVSVRVLDFGIAKVLEGGDDVTPLGPLTETGGMLGTPCYMAPEQLYGERDIDTRADVFALGVVLHECLSGRRPTEAENIGQILRIFAAGTIVPLRVAAPGVPDDVGELVDRMLDLDRSTRPASLVLAHATLARHAAGVSTLAFAEPASPAPRARDAGTSGPPKASRAAIVPGAVQVFPTTVASTTASAIVDRIPPKRSWVRRGLAIGAAVAMAAAVGGIGVHRLARDSRALASGAGAAEAVPMPAPADRAAAPQDTALVASASPASAASTTEPAVAAPSRSVSPPARPTGVGAPRPTSPVALPPAASRKVPAKFNPYENL
jgi:tRNA A-37 threonylcarbamoyl transferase component Bud32